MIAVSYLTSCFFFAICIYLCMRETSNAFGALRFRDEINVVIFIVLAV